VETNQALKEMRGLGKLQWGHRFTSVETADCAEREGEQLHASMGPPIYIGGNEIERREKIKELESFNGATDLHRWKRPVKPGGRTR